MLTIVAAAFLLAPLAAADPGDTGTAPASRAIDRSKSESDRLKELEIDVRSAHAKGQIDGPTAESFYLGIARVRRQMTLMGMQVGYRQRVRLRERIDGLQARLAQRRAASKAGAARR